MTQMRLSIAKAKERMDAICRQIDGKPASSKTTSRHPFLECASKDWWYGSGDSMDVGIPRTTAYLTAYFELGGERFPMTGIPLADGYLRPDRKVMRALDHKGIVRIGDGWIVVTAKGQAMVAGKSKEDAAVVALEPGTECDGTAIGQGGEGVRHKALRLWALHNPQSVVPDLADLDAQTEYLLPSADRIDVLYSTPEMRIAVEVKSSDSNEADLARGLFQCVKYRAVLAAMAPNQSLKVSAMLVTERHLPAGLNDESRRLNVPTLVVPLNRGE